MRKKKNPSLSGKEIFSGGVHFFVGGWQACVALAILELCFVAFLRAYLFLHPSDIFQYIGRSSAINALLVLVPAGVALGVLAILKGARLFSAKLEMVDMSLGVGCGAAIGLRCAIFINFAMVFRTSPAVLILINLGLLLFTVAIGFGIYYFITVSKRFRTSSGWFRWTWAVVCLAVLVLAIVETGRFFT